MRRGRGNAAGDKDAGRLAAHGEVAGQMRDGDEAEAPGQRLALRLVRLDRLVSVALADGVDAQGAGEFGGHASCPSRKAASGTERSAAWKRCSASLTWLDAAGGGASPRQMLRINGSLRSPVSIAAR